MASLKRAALAMFMLVTAAFAALMLLPAAANAASYDAWIGSTRVTDDNASDVLGDGTVSYDPATSTLALDNAHLSGVDGFHGAILYSGGDLNIRLAGSNSISYGSSFDEDASNIKGIRSGGAVAIDEVEGKAGSLSIDVMSNNGYGVFANAYR